MELNKAQTIARRMMDEHKLLDWSFDFDRAKRRFGLCSYKRKRITLSRYIVELNTETEFTDTILHEIAHALVGPGHGHNSVWRKKAIEIGSSGNRCSKYRTPPRKFKGVCSGCGNTFFKHKRTGIACGICCRRYNNGKYTEVFRVTWSRA